MLLFLLQRIEKRQAGGDFGLQTILELGLKYVPVLFNAFFGGGGGAQQQTTDRIEELDLKASSFLYLAYWAHPKKQSIADLLYFLPFNLILQEEDPFAWPTLLSMGIKIALALFTSATSGGIDKADVSPTQVYTFIKYHYILYFLYEHAWHLLHATTMRVTALVSPTTTAAAARNFFFLLKIEKLIFLLSTFFLTRKYCYKNNFWICYKLFKTTFKTAILGQCCKSDKSGGLF